MIAIAVTVSLLALSSTVLAINGVFDTPVYQATGSGDVLSDDHFALTGVAGQHEAGRLSDGSFVVNGGVISEVLTGYRGPGTIYLPNVFKSAHFCTVKPTEQEPNDALAIANNICPGEAIQGSHDGSAGTGDVYKAWVTGGPYIQIDLETAAPEGVQLLLYKLQDNAPVLLAQDVDMPFQIIAFIDSPGAYYFYVYSDPEADNTEDYTLLYDTNDGLTTHQFGETYSPKVTPPPVSR